MLSLLIKVEPIYLTLSMAPFTFSITSPLGSLFPPPTRKVHAGFSALSGMTILFEPSAPTWKVHAGRRLLHDVVSTGVVANELTISVLQPDLAVLERAKRIHLQGSTGVVANELTISVLRHDLASFCAFECAVTIIHEGEKPRTRRGKKNA